MRTSLLLALACCSSALGAQIATSPTVHVVDDLGSPVPYAVISVARGPFRIADDSGRLDVRRDAERSKGPLDLWVRRVGYLEFRGAVTPADTGARFVVVLRPAARALAAVTVEAERTTPLSRTGFYDRVDRVHRGAFVAEFLTPEELDRMRPSQTTDLFLGRRSVRVSRADGARVVLGRADCAMTILVDGQRMNKTAQESPAVQEKDATRLMGARRYEPRLLAGERLPSIDDLVGASEIMAVEIYPSLANAPAELIPLTGGGSCGLIAIWTGPRR